MSAVSFKTGDYAPDFHAFETDNFIILPWDREIIQGGELVDASGRRGEALTGGRPFEESSDEATYARDDPSPPLGMTLG